jgi:hypothetical protein
VQVRLQQLLGSRPEPAAGAGASGPRAIGAILERGHSLRGAAAVRHAAVRVVAAGVHVLRGAAPLELLLPLQLLLLLPLQLISAGMLLSERLPGIIWRMTLA